MYKIDSFNDIITDTIGLVIVNDTICFHFKQAGPFITFKVKTYIFKDLFNNIGS